MSSTRVSARTCGDESVRAGRGPGQLDWYKFARQFVAGRTVLDAGCGLGDGLRILATAAARVEGQDLDPRLGGPNVHIKPVEEIPDKSYDVVTSIDVIEHVEDPAGFLAQLARIARTGLFLTTPNWTASRCTWPYHLREYTPAQFEDLLAAAGRVTLFKGTPSGSLAYPVRYRSAYHALNALRSWAPTAFATRCLNHLLPVPCRIHSHIAAWVALGG
jgi:2-polyprenyl-3-methyl-5-hydroxy-6-metoxy-1,4-benzoquinol methylase